MNKISQEFAGLKTFTPLSDKDCTVIEDYNKQYTIRIPKSISLKGTPYTGPSGWTLDSMAQVGTDYDIDTRIKLNDIPDPAVLIRKTSKYITTKINFKCDNRMTIDLNLAIVPVCAFMRYVGSVVVPGTRKETLTKKYGFTERCKLSAEIAAKASAGVEACNASLEVKTGFEYEATIENETTRTWEQTIEKGKYRIYQTALVYAYMIPLNSSYFKDISENNPDMHWFIFKSYQTEYK